ncbi:DUF3866 family protein [Candidatus Poriferisodalis sp.]|uniref:DUF3866 family protein n=1 Tax=Candidatus Poriferisodalis sp. TaxID=3101277 RepID=UPI003B01612C
MTLADNSEAYALTDLCGIVSAGDELLVNTTAVDLGLGTGGAHVVHANLTSPWLGAAGPGRIMKARYLSVQLGVETIEESGSAGTVGQLPSLGSVRVVLCVLHSHAVALAAAVADALGTGPGYVMTDGGALPFVLSDLAAAALDSGVIATAVSAGHAFGAPIESVTVASGVAVLAQRGIDRIVVAPGPGHLGSDSPLGFAALDLAGHAAVLDRLGAATAVAVRASSVDGRPRHRGVSHHARTLAALCPSRTAVPTPAPAQDRPISPDRVDSDELMSGTDAAWARSLGSRAVAVEPLSVPDAIRRSGLTITTMGQPLAADAHACAWLGAAASWLADGA